jgi:hypothetical protein
MEQFHLYKYKRSFSLQFFGMIGKMFLQYFPCYGVWLKDPIVNMSGSAHQLNNTGTTCLYEGLYCCTLLLIGLSG